MLLVERLGEVLARRTNRRRFLGKMGMTIFGIVSAGAAELAIIPSAYAINYCQYTTSGCSCNPPNGTYCKSGQCSGPNCVSANGVNCKITTRWYSTGCWCTDVCCGIRGGYYYECCDCICPQGYCGCRQVVQTAGC